MANELLPIYQPLKISLNEIFLTTYKTAVWEDKLEHW